MTEYIVARHKLAEEQIPPVDRTYARLAHGGKIDWERKKEEATSMSFVEASLFKFLLEFMDDNKREYVKVSGFWFDFGVIEATKGG